MQYFKNLCKWKICISLLPSLFLSPSLSLSPSPPLSLDEGGPNVIVKKMIIAPVGRDEIVVDLTGDLSKKISVTLKEGVEYTIKIAFRVQREIVSGLRYVHVVSKSKLLRKCYCVYNEP